jgi:hypothetical protein
MNTNVIIQTAFTVDPTTISSKSFQWLGMENADRSMKGYDMPMTSLFYSFLEKERIANA